MKKTLGPLGGLFVMALMLAFAMPAQASWNIRQKDNGSAVWQDHTGIQVPTGDSGLVVYMTDMRVAVTAFVASHKKGKIKKVYALPQAVTAANENASVLTIGIGNGTTAAFTPISAGATISVATALGIVSSVEPHDVNVDVSQGYVISVASNGTGDGVVPLMVVIVIE